MVLRVPKQELPHELLVIGVPKQELPPRLLVLGVPKQEGLLHLRSKEPLILTLLIDVIGALIH